MKLRLSAFLCCALLSGTIAPASADTFLAEGVNADSLASSTRFYDGGKGNVGWTNYNYTRAAYNIYANTGKDLSIFGDLAPAIVKPEYSSTLDFSNLTSDNGHCWAYTSANMIQHWQSYYGVFANKVGTQDAKAPVHGLNYDQSYMEQLGGTQSLKLNKLFYDSFDGATGGSTNKAFGWYLYGENDWGGQLDKTSAPGYFRQYFSGYNDTHYTVNVQNITNLSDFSDNVKTHFGFTETSENVWEQTTKGQIMHLELRKSGSSHAITCYGFDTDEEGNITALYIVNSDDDGYQLEKVYGKYETDGPYNYWFALYTDEDCTETYRDWRVTGLSSVNTPQVLKDMLAEYEKGNLTWMGKLESWTNDFAAADPNELPTDDTGWMVYAGTGSEHAGYYNSYYSTGRGVEFNDSAASGTVAVGDDITVSSMLVKNSELAYRFEGDGKSITTDSFTREGTGELVFDGVKLTTATATLGGDVRFDELHVTGTLHADGKQIQANSVRLDGDALIGVLGPQGAGDTAVGTTALTITGGTTQVQNSGAWTALQSVAISEQARLSVGASLIVAENITTADTVTGTLAEGTTAGISTKYCIKVGTAGKDGTGNVTLRGDMSAGAYIDILGDADISGNLRARGDGGDKHISIGGNARIGGALDAASYATITGNADVGGSIAVDGKLSVGGDLSVAKGGRVESLSVKGSLSGSAPEGEAKAALSTSGSMELGGSVSNIDLSATGISIGSADGIKLTLEDVTLTLQGGELQLSNVDVRGNSSLVSGVDGTVLTLRADNVTLVLDAANSRISTPAAQGESGLLGSSLVQNEVASNTLLIESSLLQGLNVEGSLTLDISDWMEEIRSGGYDSVELSFENSSALSAAEDVQLALGNGNTVQMSSAEGGSANSLVFDLSGAVVPEPGTATLSLLALAALAARRRRR